MKKFIWVLVVILLATAAFAQETTAGLQGTVKDPTGAVLSKATVEVTGSALIGAKKVETDQSGYYRFANLPPGEYSIVVTAAGFKSLKRSGVRLEVGKLPTLDLNMEIGGTEQVVEVTGAAPLVDVATSKVQTNVTPEILGGIPKGRSFQSVIQFAPGARYEPLQSNRTTGVSGYQIDGASSSENSYLVEGQDTGDVQSGETKTNTPFEFIQEVQVKTSGFEAEYGGALGGVVNVIQKRGSNNWHGSVFSYYQGDFFNAAPARALRHDPQVGIDWNNRLDSPYQYYQAQKDHRRIIEPGFEAGGYLKKDRLWVFTSFVPRIDRLTRTIDNWNYIVKKQDGTLDSANSVMGKRTFFSNEETYYALSRADALLTQKIRVYGAWQYAYDRNSGTALPTAQSVFGQFNSSATSDPDSNYRTQIGNVQPNMMLNFGADITITPNLVATTRFGRTYSDYQDRGLLAGDRYRWRDSNYLSGIGYQTISATNAKSLTNQLLSTVFPAGAQGGGFNTMGVNSTTLFDKNERRSLSQDAAYFKKGFLGTHNFKAGYALNRLSNDVNNGYNTSQIYVAYARPYTVLPANQPVCAQIIAQNQAAYGAPGGTASACQGLWGTINLTDYGEVGKVSSMNHSLYLQDAWTMGHGVTVNVGVRADKETLPSFAAGAQGISFGFGDKIAPRLGASWDVLQNGKLKIYGSFGYFFDIMKYEMPRGSFGGAWWHDCVYALDDPDYSKVVPTKVNGHYCPATGPANLAGGAAGLRFIENKDFRIPSNDPSNYAIDPNLKPMKQHEYVFGADYALTPVLGFETRYSRKRLDRTIEDAGLVTSAGEQFFIVNPGEGIHKQPVATSECVDCPTQPKANRNYDSVEFRLTKKASDKWFGSLSYTYSRLYGNYSGLTSTDNADSSTGRSSPNVDRAFDEPWMQFDAHGRAIDGPLATDRPHTLKAYGWYRMKWFGQETLIGAGQQWYSGTPLTTYFDSYGANQYVEGRGYFVPVTRNSTAPYDLTFGKPVKLRTPMFSQTDVNLAHEMKVSKTNEALRLGFEATVNNLFNQRSKLNYDTMMIQDSVLPTAGIPATSTSGVDYHSLMRGYNWQTQANVDGTTLNSQYGLPNYFQAGRNMRFKVKFTF